MKIKCLITKVCANLSQTKGQITVRCRTITKVHTMLGIKIQMETKVVLTGEKVFKTEGSVSQGLEAKIISPCAGKLTTEQHKAAQTW
jgi:hypothetical protein